MSITAIVRKGEIFAKRWNSETKTYEEKRKNEQTLSGVLQCQMVVEDTTFGQFFELIVREKELFEKIFAASMYGHPIEPYVKEISQPAKQNVSLDYVHVYWSAEIYEEEMDLYAGFGGWGDWSSMDMPEKGGIAIEFTALNEYKDVPLRLDNGFEIWEFGKEPGVRKSDIKAKREFTVYDVIEAILNEITWSGDISKGRDGKDPGCEAGSPEKKKV